MWLWCNGKKMGIIFASGFLYLYLCLYKSPCQQVTEMKGIKRECREGWNSPVWGICYCSFLGASWVPCVGVHDRSHGDSVWLFIPWGWRILCKCKVTFTALFSRIVFGLVPVDCHQWACFFWLVTRTNARVCSSGWCMRRVGVISSVFSLLFFVYVLIRKKRFVISILSQHLIPTASFQLPCSNCLTPTASCLWKVKI